MELYFKIKTVITIISCLLGLGVVSHLLFSCAAAKIRIERASRSTKQGEKNAKQ